MARTVLAITVSPRCLRFCANSVGNRPAGRNTARETKSVGAYDATDGIGIAVAGAGERKRQCRRASGHREYSGTEDSKWPLAADMLPRMCIVKHSMRMRHPAAPKLSAHVSRCGRCVRVCFLPPCEKEDKRVHTWREGRCTIVPRQAWETCSVLLPRARVFMLPIFYRGAEVYPVIVVLESFTKLKPGRGSRSLCYYRTPRVTFLAVAYGLIVQPVPHIASLNWLLGGGTWRACMRADKSQNISGGREFGPSRFQHSPSEVSESNSSTGVNLRVQQVSVTQLAFLLRLDTAPHRSHGSEQKIPSSLAPDFGGIVRPPSAPLIHGERHSLPFLRVQQARPCTSAYHLSLQLDGVPGRVSRLPSALASVSPACPESLRNKASPR